MTSRLDFAKLSAVSRLERQMNAAALGIAEARVNAARERASELSSSGDEVLGVLDFGLEGKSMSSDAAGLHVEGYAAGFSLDRENEAFEPGAFDKGLETYLRTNPVLIYHHKYEMALGVVEDARVDSRGLFIRARLDPPEPGTVFADIFRKVKSGTIRGFSVGGIFKRKMTPKGPRIYAADVVEISVTPCPVEAGSLFAVSDGKAVGKEATTEQLAQLSELLGKMDRAASK